MNIPMRLLVTRPREDAEALAGLLRERGIETLVEPLLEIEFTGAAGIDLLGVQALLATSANGVRALARSEGRRDLPLFAVGDATARAAAEAGFTAVVSAAGDVEDLARLVSRRLDADRGTLVHVAGTRIAGDLAGILEASGFTCRREVLYRARPASRLSPAAIGEMEAGTLDGGIFFSPRTAATFASLVGEGGLAEALGVMTAFCLSPAVAEKAGALPWRRLVVAERPDQESLLAAIERKSKASE